MNEIKISGHIGNLDPIRYSPDGKKIFSFTLADNYGKGIKQTVTWWKIIFFGEDVLDDPSRVSKGNKVEITGRAMIKSYQKKDGSMGYSNEVYCNEIIIEHEIKSPEKMNLSSTQNFPSSMTEEDIPF